MTLDMYIGRPDFVGTLESPVIGSYSSINLNSNEIEDGVIYQVLSEHLRQLNESLQALHERVSSRLKRIAELRK